MNVIPFPTRRAPRTRYPRIEPPMALASTYRANEGSRSAEADEDRRRVQQNLGAAAVVIVLVLVGSWLMDQLQAHSRIQACLEAGHYNCLPLDIPPQ
ncbi:MAG TPA: hypothetical protein VG900_08520 [Hyphomicrobiaceae bacterium]|nr:hypothetical protein [Hyphomicrobiaceae bacterium]